MNAKVVNISALKFAVFICVCCLAPALCSGREGDAVPANLIERPVNPPFRDAQIISIVEHLRGGVVVARTIRRSSRDAKEERIIEFRLAKDSWVECNLSTGVDVVKVDKSTLYWKSKDSICVASKDGAGNYFEAYFLAENTFLDGEQRARLRTIKREASSQLGTASGL